MRVVLFFEGLLVSGLIFLGMMWPSIYTILALLFFPSLICAIAAFIWPKLVRGGSSKNISLWVRRYIHTGAAVSVFSFGFQVLWMASTRTKHPVDIIFESGSEGPYRILFPVSGGEEPAFVNSRRVYEFSGKRIILSNSGHDDGWWLEGERRYYMKTPDGTKKIEVHASRGSGTSGDCVYQFEEYVIGENTNDSLNESLDDHNTWGVVCEVGKPMSASIQKLKP